MLEAAFFQRLTEIFPHTPTASQSAVLQEKQLLLLL